MATSTSARSCCQRSRPVTGSSSDDHTEVVDHGHRVVVDRGFDRLLERRRHRGLPLQLPGGEIAGLDPGVPVAVADREHDTPGVDRGGGGEPIGGRLPAERAGGEVEDAHRGRVGLVPRGDDRAASPDRRGRRTRARRDAAPTTAGSRSRHRTRRACRSRHRPTRCRPPPRASSLRRVSSGATAREPSERSSAVTEPIPPTSTTSGPSAGCPSPSSSSGRAPADVTLGVERVTPTARSW